MGVKMKTSLTDLIAGGLGDNILIYRKDLNVITGGVIGSIMLGQLIYWAAKNDYKPFYKFIQPCGHALYKEGDSWTEELGIDDKTILRNFKKFEELGILTRKTDISRLTWHTINKEILDELLKEKLSLAKTPNGVLDDKTPNGAFRKTPNGAFRKTPNGVLAKTPNGAVSNPPNGVVSKTPNGVLYTYAENTAETTTKITFDAGEKATRDYLYGNRWDNRWLIDSDKPSFVSDKIWADFCAFRRERGQKITRTQLKAFLNELQKAHNLGVDVNARILECISKGYASPVLELRTNEINAKSKAEGVRQSRQTLKNWAAKKMAAENEIIDGEITNDTTRIQCGF